MKNKLENMKRFQAQYYIGLALFCLMFATSCNKDFKKLVPDSGDGIGDISYKVPKVLYLIVDGARGSSVRDAQSPNIKSLIGNSIYTWNSLSDTTKNNATNWADMMTGVLKAKHKVLTPDFAGNKLGDYKVFFELIKSVRPDVRIASFASSDVFKANLTTGASVSESFNGNDVAVKNRLVDFLKTDTASIVLGQFSAVQKAGSESEFDLRASAYANAISTFDTQVGEILTSIKSRANYAKENWLIIVTSNRGGQFQLPANQDDKTLFSNTNANTFTIFHNPAYQPTFIGRPFLGNTYSGTAVRFKGDPEKSVGLVNNSLSPNFNFGTDQDFTVSIKIKKGSPKDTGGGQYWYEWPSIVGKRNQLGWGGSTAPGNPGWDICLFYNGWRLFFQGGEGNINGEQPAGRDFSGDTWHDLTFVVERKADGNRYLRMYTDGVKGFTNYQGGSTANPNMDDYRMPGRPNMDNTAPMRVGFAPGEINGNRGYINVQLAELKIWKAALPEAVIQQYSCDATMDESHPYWDYIAGYWPMIDGSGNTLADKGPFEANMTLGGTYAWENFSDLICSPSNSNLGTLVPKNADIPTQILSWFNIPRQDVWNLDGRVWIPN